MEAIEFVILYPSYIEEIQQVIKPELKPVLDELRQIEPTDLVRPESWFQSESEARGYVWSMFVWSVKNIGNKKVYPKIIIRYNLDRKNTGSFPSETILL